MLPTSRVGIVRCVNTDIKGNAADLNDFGTLVSLILKAAK